ncbi:MAG: hypothetical protein KA143_04620 [Saprospiraceae bacterium]|nr:hypothetical protein [Saprospiraceae bacterium]
MDDSSEFIPELSIQDSYIDRDTLVAAMQVRVLDLLQNQPDLLFSYLYRLDVLEHKIQAALAAGENVSKALAELIIDRQVERIRTKKQYPKPDNKWNWDS